MFASHRITPLVERVLRLGALEDELLTAFCERGDFVFGDLAPKFYPAVSSLLAFGLPCLAVEATGAGAEPLA